MAHVGRIAGSPIYEAARTCSELFERLLASIQNGSKQFLLVEELRGRFGLWIAYVGVYAAPKASLDARLDDHHKIKGMVLELIDMVQRNLNWELVIESNGDAESQSSQDSELEDPDDTLDVLGLSATEAAIDRLLILAVAIRRSSRRIHAPRQGSNDENAKSLCCRLVRARYPNARQSLCDQLGASIYQRGASLLYLKKHNQKLAFERHDPNATTDDADQAIFPDNTGDELDNITDRAKIDAKARAIAPETLPSVLSPSLASKVTRTKVKPSGSIMSQGWTIKDDKGESFYYPKRPEITSDKKYQVCNLCGDPLEESDLTKEAWEAHVDQDLEPYVCISEECRDPPRFFARRRDWLDHMQTRHSMTWSDKIHTEQWHCDISHDTPLEFDTKETFVKHLTKEHSNQLSKSKLEGRARRNRRIATRDPFVCPFCGCVPDDMESRAREKLSQHIAIHLKSLAFLSLSYVEEDADEKNSATDSSVDNEEGEANISRTSIRNRNLESFDEIPKTEILENGVRKVDEHEFSVEPLLLEEPEDWEFLPENILQPDFQLLANGLGSRIMNEAGLGQFGTQSKEPESISGAFQTGMQVWYDPYYSNHTQDAKHRLGTSVDICFVHGFLGNRDDTWVVTGSSEPWPSKFLAPEVPTARLLAWGYDASLIRSGPTQTSKLLERWAEVFINEWKSTEYANKALILVAHSDGGLLCKQIFQNLRNGQHSKNLGQRLKGIIFINTIHIPNTEESLTYHNAHYERFEPYSSIHVEFMKTVEELDANEEIKIATLHTKERLKSALIKGYKNVTLSSISEEDFTVSTPSEFGFNAILQLVQAWITHFGLSNVRDEHSKGAIPEDAPISKRLTQAYEMFHSFFDLFKARLRTTTLSRSQMAFEIKQLIVSGIMLVEISDNIHQESNTETGLMLPEFHKLLIGLTLFTRNTLFTDNPETDITSQNKTVLLSTLGTCASAAMNCYIEANSILERNGDIECEPKEDSHLIDLSFLDAIINGNSQESGISKSNNALLGISDDIGSGSNLAPPLPAPTDDELSEDDHSLISLDSENKVDDQESVSGIATITEAEARGRLSTYVVVRLVKIADDHEIDEKGNATRPIWEKARITVDEGISQPDARRKVRDLKHGTKSVFDKKAECIPAIQRQLDRAQEQLSQADLDKRYRYSLVQFESLLKRLDDHNPEPVNHNTKKGKNRKEEGNFSLSQVTNQKAKYERTAIIAYFQRAPTPDQNCIQMVKNQEIKPAIAIPKLSTQKTTTGKAPVPVEDGLREEDISDFESNGWETDWDWGLYSSTSQPKKATSEHDKEIQSQERPDLLPAYNYLCHIGEAKAWIERVIDKQIPPIFELEQALSDGVILAELTQALNPDKKVSVVRDRKRLTRHTTNTAIFIQYLQEIGLPNIFRFELMDLVERRNIAQVIYCIHNLGWFLYEKGTLNFKVENLIGALEFESHELEKARETIEKLGNNMPDFDILIAQGSDNEDDEEGGDFVAPALPISFGSTISQVFSDIQAHVTAKENKDFIETEMSKIRILDVATGNSSCLDLHDADYFDMHCQRLFHLIKTWTRRFSKASDLHVSRLTADIHDENVVYRLKSAILDGTHVDEYLKDRVKRRHMFICVAVGMIWEYIFTRYLFGVDRATRAKLKGFEKSLAENTAVETVRQWRAVMLKLLTKEDSFPSWRERDTQAVTQYIWQFFNRLLPPPSHLEEELRSQLHEVMVEMVDISIQMRCQLAEFMMLPPLQPEYDENGELAQVIQFHPSLMVDALMTDVSQEELEAQESKVTLVYFPLVVQKGDDQGKGDEEVVVYPAQVLVSQHVAEIKDGTTSDISDTEE